MVPVTVTLHGSVKPQALHFEVIDQPQITPTAVLVCIYQALQDSNSVGGDTSFHIRGNIDVEGFAPVPLDNWVAPAENQAPNLGAALMVGRAILPDLQQHHPAGDRSAASTLDVEAVPERRTMQLEGARTFIWKSMPVKQSPWKRRCAHTVALRRIIRIPVVLPASLPDGPLRLLVSDGAALDRVTQPPARRSATGS